MSVAVQQQPQQQPQQLAVSISPGKRKSLPPLPADSFGAKQQECLVPCYEDDAVQPATELSSPRQRERERARQANLPAWFSVSASLWTDGGKGLKPRLSWVGRLGYVLTLLYVVSCVWKLALFIDGQIRQISFVAIAPAAALGVFLLRFTTKCLHPQAGALGSMFSFQPLKAEVLAGLRKKQKICVAITVSFAAYHVTNLILNPSMLERLERLLHWPLAVLWVDSLLQIGFFACLMAFVYTLVAASQVACEAAIVVKKAVRLADKDMEAGTALASVIGPRLQMLVEEVLRPLADSWGLPVALVVANLLLYSLLAVPDIIAPKEPGDDVEALSNSCITFCLALMVVYPPSMVTTHCDAVRRELNELRTAGDGSGQGMVDRDTADAIHTIELWLGNLNEGQGPGFVMGGKVVSRAYLVAIGTKVATYAGLIIQFLSKLQTSLDEDVGAHRQQTGNLSNATVVLGNLPLGSYNLTATAEGFVISQFG